jgi:hypothetical protein
VALFGFEAKFHSGKIVIAQVLEAQNFGFFFVEFIRINKFIAGGIVGRVYVNALYFSAVMVF